MLKKPVLPRLLYGTAWKEERSASLTFQALQCGFRAIDTANQRKHYNEEGVGQGLGHFLDLGTVKREDLFLQTKFTFARSQDHRKPYNETDRFSKQVADSFASSLRNLNTTYLDSYILHGPFGASGIGPEDLEVWTAMEKLSASGQVKYLGVSNVSTAQLRDLHAQARVKPMFVQNRCYARLGWDKTTREFCKTNDLHYQGFSLLTANRAELQTPLIHELTKKYNKSTPQIVFRFCGQLGMICLTGTTSEEHMKQDLDTEDFELTAGELSALESIAF